MAILTKLRHYSCLARVTPATNVYVGNVSSCERCEKRRRAVRKPRHPATKLSECLPV